MERIAFTMRLLPGAEQDDMARLIDPCIDPSTGFPRRLEEVFRLD